MKLELRNILYYGEWDSEEDTEYEVFYWFEKSSMQFFSTDRLIDEYGYKNCEEIKSSGFFVPAFKTDIISVHKDFIAKYHDKEIQSKIDEIIADNNYGYSSGYEVAFRILTQDFPEYDEFSEACLAHTRQKLFDDAKEWCDINGIPYYKKYDSERELDLRDTLSFSTGWVKSNSEGEFEPFDFWLCKENFEILDPADIGNKFGYENENEIVKSGKFVQLYNADVEKIEKEYYLKNNTPEMAKKINEFLTENAEDDDEPCSYEEAFWCLIDFEDWNNYQDNCKIKVAKEWCKQNNIPYYISKTEPDHKGSLYQADNEQ